MAEVDFGSFYLNRITISNIFSFYGRHQVDLEPFTAIICNYHEGKEDLFRVIEFACGADLKDLLIDDPKNLVHKIYWRMQGKECEVECFVQISLKSVSEDKSLTLYRGVRNSALEHKINGRLVSYFRYGEVLDDLNLNIKHKNIVFHKAFFHDVVWGNPEDLELLVAKTLRFNSKLSEWKEVRSRIKYLKDMTKRVLNLTKMKKSQGTIEKFTNSFMLFKGKVDSYRESMETGYTMKEDLFTLESLEIAMEDTNFNSMQMVEELAEKENKLMEKYNHLEEKENKLLCLLYFHEAKLSSKPAKDSLVLERIAKLHAKLKNDEISLSLLRNKMIELESHLDELGHKISMDMATLWDVQQSYYLRSRMTPYGRFRDYLQPNKLVNVLRVILGENIFNSHLCDEVEIAILRCQHLKAVKYEGRETFIAFENYSVKLKDLLLTYGEEGIRLNTIHDLQIFLCKLKRYGLITQVPIVMKRRFNFNLDEGKNYSDNILYPKDGIFLHSEGLISYSFEYFNNSETSETQESVIQRVNGLLREEELKYQEYRGLHFCRLKMLYNIQSLESDIIDLKRKDKRLFENFGVVFDQDQKKMEDAQKLEKSDEIMHIRSASQTSEISHDEVYYSRIEGELSTISEDLEETEIEKTKVIQDLVDLEKRIDSLNIISDKVWFPPVAKFILLKSPKDRYSYYYDHELEKQKILMSNDEIEEFGYGKKWRKETMASLSRNLYDDRLAKSSKELCDLTESRKRILSPLLEHCSHHLTPTFQFIMDTSLPFLELGMTHSEDGLELLSSLPENNINIVPIGHFNTFLKFIAALSFLLELVIYDKIPFILLDDVHEFLPEHMDTFEAVLGNETLARILTSNENIYFQVLARIGQYMGYYVKKNKSGNGTRTRKSSKAGPAQIIYFANNDLVHAACHQLWIRNKLLPDEYISKDSNSYSALEEIHHL